MGMYLQAKSHTQNLKISCEFESLLIKFKGFLDEIQDIGRITRYFANENRIVRDSAVNVLVKVVRISNIVNSILMSNGNSGSLLFKGFEKLISEEIRDCLEENRIISEKESVKYEINNFMSIGVDSPEYRMFDGKEIDEYILWKKLMKINDKISNIDTIFQTLGNNLKNKF